ncbi:Type I restriction-modification system, specificity subunit S [Methanosarcina lacustris Z-7289]|uniref:Type I restriction-modification system, specificity subunit S n=1 Tax=Methanosarcina lacustris Z-7289 TaxID=1434111 RepID=A0A0E3S7M9_9EURY|nr:restriction endonuclease subunit S [Methanosarcina lacustris]AKB75038.1 Type I restriction-modification system, specificity subunit S [Methanosarcina lacustris Z-7289]
MTKNVSVPEGYKKTELGVIPEDWQIVKLSEISKTYSGGTPSKSKVEYFGGNIPWVKSGELNKGLIFTTEEFISELGLNNSSVKWVPQNSILIAMYGATAGKIGLLKIRATINQAILAVVPQEDTDYLFLYYSLNQIMPNVVKTQTQGSGQPNLNAAIIKSNNVLLPPLPEQQKIASILSKVDEQIEQTEQIIEKTEVLKKGLMQKLLIKGIGHTEFKKTELGEIPEEWEIGNLSNISQVVMGQSPTGDTYNTTGEGKPLINGPSEFNERYPTPVKWTSKPTKICKIGDILFCVRGNTLGRMNFADQEYCIGRGIAAISGLKNLGDTNFVHMLLTKEGTELYRRANGEGSTFPNIKRDQLNEIKIAVPSLPEQQKIASILSKVDSQIQDNQSYLHKLQELRKGLMQDLLTGKVRVCV